MSIWERITGQKSAPRAAVSADDPSHWSDAGATTRMSVNVSTETVQQIPEVYACLKTLAETTAQLPLVIYRQQGDRREEFREHPIFDLLHDQPNPEMDAYEFRYQMTWDLMLHRNAFAEVVENQRGAVGELWRVDPSRFVKAERVNGQVVYTFRQHNGTQQQLPANRVFHLRAPPLDESGLVGRSLLIDGARTFARALALEDYARRFFENDATPSGVVTVPKMFPNDEQAQEFRKRWNAQFRGAKRHSVGILEAGATWADVNVPNDKAQFLETYKEVTAQVLRLFRMQPHMVGVLDKATFSNIEQQSLEYVVYTLMPGLIGWEKGIKRQLILGRQFFAAHNVAGLLRGDLKARYEAYAIGRNWGWLSVNDILKRENLNPVPEGDVRLQPLNMAPAGSVQQTEAALTAAIDHIRPQLLAAMSNGKLIEGDVND